MQSIWLKSAMSRSLPGLAIAEEPRADCPDLCLAHQRGFVMRTSGWTPSIVPQEEDQTVYLVLDNLGKLGLVWREAEGGMTDLETVTRDLLEGQYTSPVR